MKQLLGAAATLFATLTFGSPDAHAAWATKDYAEVTRELKRIAATYPANASLFELGTSDSGEMIRGLKVGSGAVQNLVVATHHGNEYGSTEVALAFAQDLALRPVDGQTVYVIPVTLAPKTEAF